MTRLAAASRLSDFDSSSDAIDSRLQLDVAHPCPGNMCGETRSQHLHSMDYCRFGLFCSIGRTDAERMASKHRFLPELDDRMMSLPDAVDDASTKLEVSPSNGQNCMHG